MNSPKLKFMFTLPPEFSEQISSFAPVFHTKKVFEHAVLLLTGAILCPGRRTISSVLRILNLDKEHRYHKYYRVLSRSTWGAKTRLFYTFTATHQPFDRQEKATCFCLRQYLRKTLGKTYKSQGHLSRSRLVFNRLFC